MITRNTSKNTLWINDDICLSIEKDLDGKYIKANVWSNGESKVHQVQANHYFKCPTEAARYLSELAPKDANLVDVSTALFDLLQNS